MALRVELTALAAAAGVTELTGTDEGVLRSEADSLVVAVARRAGGDRRRRIAVHCNAAL